MNLPIYDLDSGVVFIPTDQILYVSVQKHKRPLLPDYESIEKYFKDITRETYRSLQRERKQTKVYTIRILVCSKGHEILHYSIGLLTFLLLRCFGLRRSIFGEYYYLPPKEL